MSLRLEEGEFLLEDQDEWWYRQVREAHVDGDEVSFRAFIPNSGDNGEVSGARGTKREPDEAFDDYEGLRPGWSAGTWGLTVAELTSAYIWCIDDSARKTDLPKPVGHAYLDFRDVSKAFERVVRIGVAAMASSHGCLHRR